MSELAYMLDTETCIHLINRHPKVRRKAPPTQCAISVIVLGELELAACCSDHTELISAFTKRISIVALEDDTVSGYADMRAFLETDGRSISSNALWSAAHALVLGLSLVAMNPQTFSGIPELTVTTWLCD